MDETTRNNALRILKILRESGYDVFVVSFLGMYLKEELRAALTLAGLETTKSSSKARLALALREMCRSDRQRSHVCPGLYPTALCGAYCGPESEEIGYDYCSLPEEPQPSMWCPACLTELEAETVVLQAHASPLLPELRPLED